MAMMRKLPIIFVLASLVFGGAASAADLVKIGKVGESIVEQDIKDYIQRRIDLKQAEQNQAFHDKVLREALMTRLLELEGASMGMANPRVGAKIKFDDAYALAVYKRIAPKCEPPSVEAELEKFYAHNKVLFRTPPTVRLSRITLPTDASVDKQPAERYLKEALEKMQQNELLFEDVVKRAAEINPDDLQGDLGWLNISGDEDLLKKLRQVPAGGYLGPFTEKASVYLIKVEQRSGDEIIPWGFAKNGMAKNIFLSQCRSRTENEVREKLINKYDVTFVRP